MVPEYAVTLNAPRRGNALSAGVVETIHASLPAPRTSAKVATFVLQAEGHNFSTGFDFGDWREYSHGDLLLRFVQIINAIQRIERLDCLTVARVQGGPTVRAPTSQWPATTGSAPPRLASVSRGSSSVSCSVVAGSPSWWGRGLPGSWF